MKKTHKRTISLVLAIVICLSFSVSAFATGNQSSLVDEVTDIVNSIMTAIEPNKSMYGLGGVDFTDLTLGQEIPAYEMKSSGPVRLTEVHYFPILSAGQWVATATVSYNEGGETNVTVSRDYIDTYEAAATSVNTGAAIIFDTNSAYIYTGAEVEVVEMSTEATAGRVTLNRNVAMPLIAMSNFATVADIELENATASTASTQAYPLTFSLGVPAYKQNTSNSCWAYSLRSIMKFYGTDKSIAQIRTALFGSNIDSMASTAQAAATIRSFGFRAGSGYGDNGNFYYSLSLANIQRETYDYRAPIFAAFKYSSGSVGHAVVVHGYSATTGTPTVTFMDPATGTFKASQIPSSNMPSYVNTSGVTLTFASGFGAYK